MSSISGCSQEHYICSGKARLDLKRHNNVAISVVKKTFDLNLNAFTRRTAIAGTGSEKSARFVFVFGFDTPFLDPRDQHFSVEQAGFCLGRGLGGNPGRA
jgi:hypothetical protein